MEIKLLRAFVTIANEGSITRAAEMLHITQPALSRQLVQLEKELGCTLFVRGKNHMTLTEEGLLLLRRANEILELVGITESELHEAESQMEGSISIGSGELSSTQTLVDLVCGFHGEFPNVLFHMLTGVADQVAEQLDRGLLDFGLFLEPIDKSDYDYIEMPIREKWVAVMRPDNPQAAARKITKADLKSVPLILPNRVGAQSELARWFGRGFANLDKRFTINLGGIAAALVEKDLGVLLCVEGATTKWDSERFAIVPLAPSIETSVVLAWKRDVARTSAVNAFIDYATDALGR